MIQKTKQGGGSGKGRVTKLTPHAREKFLQSLREVPNVALACATIGVSRTAAYRWRDDDPLFAEQWEDAIAQAVGTLEKEARRRAFEGCRRIRFHKDGCVAEEWIEYSDLLMTKMLAAHHPGYRKSTHEVSGPEGKPIAVSTWSDLIREVARRESGDEASDGEEGQG